MPGIAETLKPSSRPAVTTGAARLAGDSFSPLKGKRVGLVTNHTGRIGDERLIDAMAHARGVELAAVLTPEHGLSGVAEAGAKVGSGKDAATGVRVHSLYGTTLKPTPGMLAGLDLLVFDIQDIGARFYTYISTMGLCMQAAAAAGLPFVVLDRPNPLGGEYISGFVLDKAFASFVGRYELPIAHGLTVGELARMIKGERMLPGLDRLALDVIAIEGWQRSMCWPAIGAPWVPTSPNIPTYETALAYAGTGLFEATIASEGRGTDTPFLALGHPQIDASAIIALLSDIGLPGCRFDAGRMTPRVRPGTATAPRFRDSEIPAVRISITDAAAYQPVETGVHVLAAFAAGLRKRGTASLITDSASFDRLAGTNRLRMALDRGAAASDIVGSWSNEVGKFGQKRAQYLIYS